MEPEEKVPVPPDIRKAIAAKFAHHLADGVLGRLSAGASYIVPASAGLYVVGFLTCVFHYHRRGVPLSALGYAQVLAAGLLPTVTLGLGIAVGLHAGTKGRLRGLLYLLTWASVSWAWLTMLSDITSASTVVGFALPGALFFWLAAATTFEDRAASSPRAGEPSSARARDLIPEWLGGVVFLLIVFAVWVFPNVPQWLGGGSPREVSLTWESAPTGEEEVSAFFAGQTPRCTYEVLADTEMLYLMTMSPSGTKCSPRLSGWRAWYPAELSGSDRRFVAVPRQRLRMLLYK